MTGEEERHGLVADLKVRHRGAVFVPRREQHAQEVAAVIALTAALTNDLVEDRVELGDGAPALHVRPCRHERRDRHERAELSHRAFHRDGEGATDLAGARTDLGVEQRLADDLEREPHHPLGDVEDSTRLERRREGLAALCDERRVRGDAPVREGGRDEPPLAGVNVPFAGEETPAEQRPQEDRQARGLHERGVVEREDLMCERRGADHDGGKEPDA